MAIVLRTISDSKQAQQDLAKLRESVDGIKKSTESASQKVLSFGKAFIIGGGITLALKKYMDVSDTLTNINSRLRLVTKSQEQLNDVFMETAKIALRTRTNMEGIVNLYTKMARAGEEFNVTQKQTLRFTESVSKAMLISGASTTEAAAALLQFGQGLASNRLSGEELRSVLENAPELAQLIADGLGVARGELKKLGEDGALTFPAVFKAIYKQTALIDEKAKKIGVTFQGAFTNIGNSLFVLGATIKGTFLSMKTSLADVINNVAMRIFNFAERFDFLINNTRAKIALFVTDIVLAFGSFNFESILSFFGDIGSKLSSNLTPIAENIKTTFQTVFATVSGLAVRFYNYLSEVLRTTEIGQMISSGFNTAAEFIKESVVWIKDNLKGLFTEIDLSQIFPGLDDALITIKSWIKEVERWFYWLYDKVIGNSWIPDLVKGVISWFGKLLGPALRIIKAFILSTNSMFAKLTIGAALLVGLTKLKNVLFSFYGILTAIIGLTVTAFAMKIKKPDAGSAHTGVKDRATDLLGKIRSAGENTFKNVKELATNFKKSEAPLVRTVKQILGMPDRVPGQIGGEDINTKGKVGRGPSSNREDRPLFHDFINALPRDLRAPLVATFTTALGLAVSTVFSGPAKLPIMAVFTAAAVGFSTKIVDSGLIREFFGKVAFFFTSRISDGITKILGGNAVQDPLGLLAAITAASLLFEKGREMIFGGLARVAKFPTTLAGGFGQQLTKSTIDAELAKNASILANHSKYLADRQTKFSTNFDKTINKLVGTTSRTTGQVMDRTAITQAVANKDFGQFGGFNRFIAGSARVDMESMQGKGALTQSDLRARNKELAEASKNISKEISASKAAFLSGVKNFTAGLGGVIGGVAGYQVGTEIAKGMESSPAWVRIGVQMAGAFIGQGIGSALGIVIATVMIAGFKASAVGIGLILAKGFAAAVATGLFASAAGIAAAIAAALLGGYLLWKKLPEDWRVVVSKVFDDFIKQFYGKPWERLMKALSNSARQNAESESGSAQKGPMYEASGGYIRGPGSGTSDSIPAMLSNGEFIINAAAARRNRGLLEAINSGKVVKQFGAGGSVTDTNWLQNKVVLKEVDLKLDIRDPIERLIDWLKEMVTKLGSMMGFGGGDTPSAPPPERKELPSFREILEKQGKAGYVTFAKALETSFPKGEVQIDPKSLESLPAQTLSDLTDLLDTRSRLQNQIQKFGDGPLKKMLQGNLTNIEQSIRRRARGGDPNDILKLKEKGGGDSIEYKDFLGGFNAVFRDLNLTQEEFSKMPGFALKAMNELTSPIIGLMKQREDMPVEQTGEITQKINEMTTQSLSFMKTLLNSLRAPFEQFKDIFEKAEVNINKDTFDSASPGERSGLVANATAQKDWKAILKVSNIEEFPEAIALANKELTKLDKELNILQNQIKERNKTVMDKAIDMLQTIGIDPKFAATITNATMGEYERLHKDNLDAAKDLISDNEQTRLAAMRRINENNKSLTTRATQDIYNSLQGFDKIQEALRQGGQSIEKETFNIIPDALKKQIEGSMDKMTKLANDAKYSDNPDVAKAASLELRAMRKAFSKQLAKYAGDMTEAEKAAEDFANGFASTFHSNFGDLLKGKEAEGKSAWKSFLDKFMDDLTSMVIDTFVSGLTKKFAEKAEGMLEKIGAGIFNVGFEGLGGLLGESTPKKAPADSMAADAMSGATDLVPKGVFEKIQEGFSNIPSMFEGLWDNLSTMLKGAGSALKEGFGALMTLFMAEGGLVKGPGSALSDSIPAMLSNGEFVVNARAARKYGGVLDAINNGRTLRLADGGLVSATSMMGPAMTANRSLGKSEQQININITGDISRQTRAEIISMLPSITNGVNLHNRERGYRGNH